MLNKIHLLLLLLGITMAFSGCLVPQNPYTGLPPGVWRAVLRLDPMMSAPRGVVSENTKMQFEEVSEGDLPFTFEVKYENDTSFYIEIINGTERIRVDDITIGRDRSTAKDTIIINFPVFDSYIRGIWQENIIEGEWVVNNRENYHVPFVAKQGENYRFTTMQKKPDMDVSGKWEVTFEEDSSKAIGEFKQKGNYLTGTFMTETGDHRFLEGTVQANKLYLSAFDGSHAYLFEAKILPDSTLIGVWHSGTHYKTTWTARRNAAFQLSDANSLTYLKPGYKNFDFAFKNRDGQTISLNDDRYKGKVKIVQILGTWCPNCRDETEFLLDYRKKNPDVPFEVIGLAFERHQDKEKAMEAIQRYKRFFNIDYEILLAGNSDDKDKASQALPMLNRVISFPTMIIIDQHNQVQEIHTGFSGPATSGYEPFKREFDTFMRQLVAKNS